MALLVVFAGTREQAVFLLVLCLLPALILVVILLRRHQRRKQIAAFVERVGAIGQRLKGEILQSFLVQPCGTCAEPSMRLLSMSPGGRSVQYQCVYCERKARALAGSPKASAALASWTELETLKTEALARWGVHINAFTLSFATIAAPMPYEQTTREPIPADVRTEVWRRDQGRCVECGTNQNLQFDHIIPVARGGATTTRNIQLLCQQCNLTKSATI